MSIIYNKLKDFKPISIDQNLEIDDTQFQQLSHLITRIGKSEQKTSQIVELMKDALSEQLESSKQLIDDVRQEKNEVKRDIKILERGLLEYFNILDDLQKAAKLISDKQFLDSINVAIQAKEQISESMGIQTVPAEPGQKINIKYHHKVDTVSVQNKNQDQTVNKVVENGYRRGDRLLRKASVIANKYEGHEHE